MKFKINEVEYDSESIPELSEYIQSERESAAQVAAQGAIKSNERQWAARVAGIVGDDSVRTLKAKDVTERLTEYIEANKVDPDKIKQTTEQEAHKLKSRMEAEMQAERRKMMAELQKEQAVERIQSKLISQGLNESLQKNKSAIEALISQNYKIEADGENVYFRDPSTDADVFDPKTNQPASWEFVADKFREMNPGLFVTAASGGGSRPTAPATHKGGNDWMSMDTDELLSQ